MSKLHKNQSGFTAIEVLLVLIFVAIVIFIGVYVAYNHNTNKPTANTPAASTKTAASNNQTPTTHTTQEATKFVQTTYDDYLAAINNAGSSNTQPLGLVGLAAVKEDLASGFYSQAAASPNGSAFSCAEQFEPSGYLATLSSSNSTSAAVGVTISNSSDGTTATPGMTVNVDLASLKITGVSCPS